MTCCLSMTHFTVRTCRFLCWGGLALLRFPPLGRATQVAKWLPPSALPVWPTISMSRYLQTPSLAYPMRQAWTTWPYLLKMKWRVLENWSLGTKTEGIRERMHRLPNVLNGRALVSAAHSAFKCQVTSTETGSSGICERSTFSSLQADLTSATLANPLTRARPAGWTSLIAQQSISFSSHPKSQMMTSSPKSHHTLICNLRQAYFLGSP